MFYHEFALSKLYDPLREYELRYIKKINQKILDYSLSKIKPQE